MHCAPVKVGGLQVVAAGQALRTGARGLRAVPVPGWWEARRSHGQGRRKRGGVAAVVPLPLPGRRRGAAVSGVGPVQRLPVCPCGVAQHLRPLPQDRLQGSDNLDSWKLIEKC